jgi:hypothetical protein
MIIVVTIAYKVFYYIVVFCNNLGKLGFYASYKVWGSGH